MEFIFKEQSICAPKISHMRSKRADVTDEVDNNQVSSSRHTDRMRPFHTHHDTILKFSTQCKHDMSTAEAGGVGAVPAAASRGADEGHLLWIIR